MTDLQPFITLMAEHAAEHPECLPQIVEDIGEVVWINSICEAVRAARSEQ